jgi:hypothetical protein
MDLAISVPAWREREARRGGTRKMDGSFRHMDAGNSARRRMFFPAVNALPAALH